MTPVTPDHGTFRWFIRGRNPENVPPNICLGGAGGRENQ
ncbi:hypothetical protein MA6G1108_5270 [Mycobacteroides abscessus 6G-1108]|nr:hypothetical protein MA6G1108_5270 [Mycobacteroides abscessus 6G-1108]